MFIFSWWNMSSPSSSLLHFSHFWLQKTLSRLSMLKYREQIWFFFFYLFSLMVDLTCDLFKHHLENAHILWFLWFDTCIWQFYFILFGNFILNYFGNFILFYFILFNFILFYLKIKCPSIYQVFCWGGWLNDLVNCVKKASSWLFNAPSLTTAVTVFVKLKKYKSPKSTVVFSGATTVDSPVGRIWITSLD